MDTNLIFLIITIILFLAIVIFDFAFFRFREGKFDDGEPLSFLTQNTLRSLKAWLSALQQPKSGETSSLQTDIDRSDTNFVIPATTQRDAVSQAAVLDSQVPPTERPVVRVEITADVPEGTIVHITMQVTDAEGKTSTQSNILTSKTSAPTRALASAPRPNLIKWVAEQINKLKNKGGLNLSLFWGAIISYALIISFAIDKWPIYFFTDEAVHMNMIADFLRNGFQNYDGEFLPTFFIKEGWVNGTSVYLQLLPYLIFGKSVIVTRLVSAFITLLGAIAIGLLLKKVMKVKYYWVGIFLLLTTPAWFLHARTAFEYAEVASFYCMFLYFYGRYRKGDLRSLYFAVLAGALCFYTHGLGQFLMGFTGLALLIVDFRYHIHPRQRKTVLFGFILGIVFLLPFVRYLLAHPTEAVEQVKRRNSYWSNSSLTLNTKFLDFLGQYFYGLNPIYWYLQNDIDFDRHVMKGLGDGLLITLPFMLIGFFQIFKTIRNLAARIGIIAMITVLPIVLSTIIHTFMEDGAWRSQIFVTSLFFRPAEIAQVNPPTFISADLVSNTLWVALALMLVGLFLAFRNIRNPGHRLALIVLLACPFPASIAAVGMPRMLWVSVPMAILTAIGISAVMKWAENRSKFKPPYSTLGLFAVLLLLSLYILRTALVDGPTWFEDYGLYGMQYGAQQIFQESVLPELENNPNLSFVVSPSWANGSEQFTDFFIPKEMQSRIHMGQPIDFIDNVDTFNTTEFVATADEFSNILRDQKFTNVNVLKNIPYPNGMPGFYIITLKPADNIADILAAQHAQNRNPIEDTMLFNNESIRVVHSPLGSGSMDLIFDNDPDSLARVLEANPFFIALYPLTPIDTHSVFIKTGSLHNYTITIRLYAPGNGQPVEYTQTYQDEPDKDLPPDPEVTINFDRGPDKAERIEIEVKDNTSGDTSAIHIRTIQFK
jgi:hypothetical protein